MKKKIRTTVGNSEGEKEREREVSQSCQWMKSRSMWVKSLFWIILSIHFV